MDRFYSSPSHQPDEPWFRLGTVDVNTTILLCGLSVVSMFVWALASGIVERLVLFPPDVRAGHVWQLVTWPIANGPSIWTVIDVAMLYLFGREIERAIGRRGYLWFVGALALLPGLVATALDVILSGAPDGARFLPDGLFLFSTGMFIAFVAAYPRAIGFFGIPLWVFGAVFVGIDVLQYVGEDRMDELAVLLVIVAISMLGARAYGISELTWIPKVPLPGFVTNRATAHPQRGRKAPRRSAGRGSRRGSGDVITMRPQNATPTSAELLRQAEIDILLDKINEHGIGSLTPEERRRLDEHSRRMRDER
jgi:hypothetical protein